MKKRILIIKLGKQRQNIYKKLAKYKSKLFEFIIDDNEYLLPNTDGNWAYRTETIKGILVPKFDEGRYDMCMGFIDYQIDGNTYRNCYGSNIKDNKVFVLSFYQIAEILATENIKLINFVLVNVYRYLTRYMVNERLIHDEPLGCINDMCGKKTEIKYSCKKPILCTACEEKLREKDLSDKYIGLLKKELKKIKKSTYYVIAEFIKKYPLLSILFGAASSVLLGILASWIYDLISGGLQ